MAKAKPKQEPVGTGYDRVMPNNIEVEQAILGTLMMLPNSFARIAGLISQEHFFEDLHQGLFHVITGQIEAGLPASPMAVKTFFPEELAEGVPTSAYLARLAAEASDPANLLEHAMVLRELYLRRRMIAIADDILGRSYDVNYDEKAIDLFEEFSGQIDEVRSTGAAQPTEYHDFDDIVGRAVAGIRDSLERGGVGGISTGYPRLDEAMGGMEAGDFIILAGRPGSGKTSLGTNIAHNVAEALQKRAEEAGAKPSRVAFFSLEMRDEQVAQRVIAERTGISVHKMRNGNLTADDVALVEAEGERQKALPLVIDETPAISLSNLAARARRIRKKHGLSLILIDYLQLMAPSQKRSSWRESNRVRELTEITTGLKTLAKEMQVPVVALSQLSRKVEERDDKRPMLSDLRESGSIEQDADAVLFIFREEYYLRQKMPKPGTSAHGEWRRKLGRCKGVAEVIIGKQRHGPPTTITMGFDGKLMRFHNDPPEPEGHEEDDGAARKALGKDAELALRILTDLLNDTELKASNVKGIPDGVYIVPYADWKARIVEQAFDPDTPEATVTNFMSRIVRELKLKNLALRGGTAEAAYAWKVEETRNV